MPSGIVNGDIAIVVHTWFPNHQILFDLVQKKLGDHHIRYFVFSSKDRNRAWQIKPDVEVAPTVVPGMQISLFSREINVNFNLSKCLAESNPQLVVIKGWGDPGYFLAHRFAGKRNIPVITWMCGRDKNTDGILRKISTRLARKAVNSSKLVFVYGSQAKRDAIELGAQPDNVIIVKHMVDDKHFDYHSCTSREQDRCRLRRQLGFGPEPLFLCISQLVDRKGITDLLDAFDILRQRKPDVQLLLIGKGHMQQVVEKYAAEHGRCFKWLPSVPYEEIPVYYSIADCFVFPTHFDAWGTVVNECHWAKLPILCSDGAHACFDLIEHGRSGFVYPAGDIDALADLMAYAVRHKSQMTRMAENAYNFVKSQWSLDDSVKLWSRYIKEAVESIN